MVIIYQPWTNCSSQDLAFYGLGLNNSIFLESTGYAKGTDLYEKLYNNSVGLIILSIAGSLPGYWAAVLTIDVVGRRPLQIAGFLILTILFCILGFAYDDLSLRSFLALYIIAQFFFNLGPNTTTFIVPGECFPTRYRATGHGLSAAAGKLGAIVAQVISLPLVTRDDGTRPDRLMQLFALFMLCGVFTSLLVPETTGLTLEELAGEPPTSHGSGRNGSVSMRASARRLLSHPFVGGQPAGLMYPRAGGVKRVWRRSPRPGGPRTASPEMAAAVDPETGRIASVRGRGWWRQKKKVHIPDLRDEYGLSSSTSSTRPINVRPVSTPPGSLPPWNAGWGKVDRGVHAPDNIRLQDVGGLVVE